MVGIYIFKNNKEKKCYIGQSSNLERRRYEHYHSNKKLKDEFHLDLRENPDNFEFSIIEYCNTEELDDKELYWMDQYKSDGWTLYNKIWRTVYNSRGKSFVCSEETKKKISKSQQGKIPWNKGKTGIYSEESLNKMVDAKKGKIPWNKGKKIGHWRINQITGKREYY